MITIRKKNIKNRIKKGFTPINIVLTLVIVALFSVSYYVGASNDNKISFSAFKDKLANEEIVEVVIKENSPYLFGTTKDGDTIRTDNPNTEESNNLIFNSGVPLVHTKSTFDTLNSMMDFVWIGLVIFIGYSVISTFSKSGPVGKSMFDEGIDTTRKQTSVTFKNVAGNEESKDAMSELVFFLKNPDEYRKYGIKAPKGAMLYGPPGTGKTLLAKAVAGEADANFLAVRGSDFVDKFVGNGASRVRHLFEEARKLQPCIIFIDEIDAVGGKRNMSFSNEERNQTLNALLAEMDGFSNNDNIIVLGATNRLDSLDNALLRSGRFDTKIYIGLPDLKARKEIFKVHSANKPIADTVCFDTLAKMTTYFSGADIENVMNKSGFYAAKDKKEFIDMNDIDKAINHIIAGDAKKDRSGISNEDKKLTAYHEAGHAIVAKLMVKTSVPRITIIPTTHGAGGYTLIDNGEQSYKSKKDLLNQIAIALGGRAAEELIFGPDYITTGASGDIKRVTELAQGMIRTYGMSSKFGLVSLADTRDLDKETLMEARNIANDIYDETLSFLTKNRDVLDNLANSLIENETILEKEFDEIIGNCVQLNMFKKIEE